MIEIIKNNRKLDRVSRCQHTFTRATQPRGKIDMFEIHDFIWPNFEPVKIFTEWAPRLIQSISCDVRLFVSLSVRHTLETTLPEGLESSGRRAYR